MNGMDVGPRIREWVQANRPRMVDLVCELVRLNSVNQVITGLEKTCNLYVAEVLRQMELEVDVYSPEQVAGLKEHPAYFPGKDYTDRPNVAGVWKGCGGGKSLLFSSHIDTAPAAMEWQTDPWSPYLEEGRLFGLGSMDMKGGLAASVMTVLCLKEIGVRLRGDVIIESVVDEEFGGANGTLAGRLKGYNADAAIVPEPTNLAVCPASRGGAMWRVTFTGQSGMSFSGERIVNPANLAAKFIVYLEEYQEERSKRKGPSPWYDTTRDELPVMVTRVEAGDMTAALCDSGPYTCHVDIWVECYPGIDEEELKKQIVDGFSRKYGSLADEVSFQKLIRFLPGTEVQPDFPLIGQLAAHAQNVTGRPAAVHGAPFACDAFMFNLYSSTPAVVMGPAGANAHGAGEYLDLDALSDLIEIYARTAIQWCGINE